MVKPSSFWLSIGFLCSLLLIVGILHVEAYCLEKTADKPLEEINRRHLAKLTKCLLDCTSGTYMRRLEIQDTRTVRFKDSSEGDLGEYCWSMQINCNPGEHFQHAYIVLPVDRSQLEGSVGLKMTRPPYTDVMWPHQQQPLLPNNCGLQFDITSYFATEQRQPKVCVQIKPQQSATVNGVLRCPPFLVTMWHNRSPTAGRG